ncbi:hypothetical protein NLJ89_g7988 [Agrocybe chaxingu]|uniref:Uncharacterized protein n=1 Tax=Agrocybe chaxingu TaxID=84603 RepID=A0A9W8MR76_9AGAR|nr:hypothetical protein NLJ89_g7988 [Agrocybe chaxingu]
MPTHYMPFSPWTVVPSATVPKNFFNYELPKTVISVRDGWQWTSQSGAVVSGLLAAVAAQLLGFFKDDENLSPSGGAGFVIASCYAALFLNIAATIGSFVLIDNLGEVGYRAAKRDSKDELLQVDTIGDYTPAVSKMLVDFGANGMWNGMLYHWLITFYLGILSLIISVLTYVILSESLATQVVMCTIVALTLFPTTFFIFSGLFAKSKRPYNKERSGRAFSSISSSKT